MSVLKRLVKSVAAIILTGTVASEAQTLSYPDQWETFLGNRDGHVALILYNVGIGSFLTSLPQQDCIIFSVQLKEPGPEGLPQPEEGDVLFKMDDAFTALIASFGAHDLGRLSMEGRRGLFVAAGGNADDLGQALVDAAAEFDYSAKFRVEAGAVGEVYTYVLSPTPEEKQILMDEKFLRDLAENEDIAEKVRQVDHWAYFPRREIAEAFGKWASENGFSSVEVDEAAGGRGDFVVRSSHDGTMLLDDITKFTLLQHRKAVELGGSYDGWETAVMR